MKSKTFLSVTLFIIALLVAACGGSSDDVTDNSVIESAGLDEQPIGEQPQFPMETREDNQGAVSVAVTPLNLNTPGETIDFEIAMNTHSVDLSMDLAELSQLTTDTGLAVNPTAWTVPGGGHHVSGDLIFPATVDGQALMEGATQVILTIRNVDAPERVFVWNLPNGN